MFVCEYAWLCACVYVCESVSMYVIRMESVAHGLCWGWQGHPGLSDICVCGRVCDRHGNVCGVECVIAMAMCVVVCVISMAMCVG